MYPQDRGERVRVLRDPRAPKINEATDTDLKVIRALEQFGWKVGDTLLYQQEYALTPEQRQLFDGKRSIKPDITLTDLNGDILAIIENKFEDEKKALTKLRVLYAAVLKPRFLYACSPERRLFYDASWKGLDAGEFRPADSFMTREEMLAKIEQQRKTDQLRPIVIDQSIAGGMNPSVGKEMYFQNDCIHTLVEKYRAGKQKLLVHMATGLGKTRTMVAFVKVLLEYNMARRVLFVVDRIMLADQALNDGFALISREFSAVRITSANFRQHRNARIHVVVIDTLENIYQDIPSTFFDLLIVDECHRSININRKLIFDHFLCPRIGLTATPRIAVAGGVKEIPEQDLAILDTYRLFGCETGEPDFRFDLERGIREQFLAPYRVLAIETELMRQAKEKGVEVKSVLDPDTRDRINLTKAMRLQLEQLNKKYITEEHCKRVAEELKKHTAYGEKVILFGASQAHCLMLAQAINREFATEEDKASPRYAEAIISDNNELNATFKKWFKDKNRKPFVAVSVDIMATGVDIPCVRYIAFDAFTQSVGKYLQMIGRGTRLDPKSGKFSFKVLDFVGVCADMQDNGKGSPKENNIVVETPLGAGGGRGGGGGGGGEKPKGDWYIIDNPDPANLIQRVYLHGDEIEIIDNLPIEQARAIFESEAQQTQNPEIVAVKERVQADVGYEPSDGELEQLRKWANNPQVFMDEGQLRKVYGFQQGTLWDFFLQALGVRKIPTPKERIEKGFESYLRTYPFSDEQIRILRNVKDIFAANVAEKKAFTVQDVFGNPVYARLIGGDYNQINRKFDGKLTQVFADLQMTFRA